MAEEKENKEKKFWDDETELNLLCSIICYPETIGAASEILSAEDFRKDLHAETFDLCKQLAVPGQQEIDVNLLLIKLAPKWGQATTKKWLEDLATYVGISVNVVRYAKTVRRYSAMRQLRGILFESTRLLEDESPAALEELISATEQGIMQVRNKLGGSSASMHASELCKFTFAALQELHRVGSDRLTTGLLDLDAFLLGGLRRKKLCFVAGRPSMGKSVLSRDIAIEQAVRRGNGVMVFTLEDNKEDWNAMVLSSMSSVRYENIQLGKLEQYDFEQLFTAADALSKSPLWVDDSPTMTIETIRAKIAARQMTDKVDMVIIDYIQLVEPSPQVSGQSKPSREQQLGHVSRSCKAIAKELNVAMVVVAQLNRECEKRSDKKPILSDMRESGSFEQDADYIIFVHRECRYDDQADPYDADVLLPKHKGGKPGVLKARFNGPCMRFESIAKREDPTP